MTREERLEKQKLCDEFITELETMIDSFKEKTGIDFEFCSMHEYETSWLNTNELRSIFKITDKQFCYRPVIRENGNTNYIYLLNINDEM